jgi:uncharacterized protein
MESVSVETLEKKLRELEEIISPYGSALVAFSGGVDSSLALAIAARALPRGRVLAVTSNNETYLSSELDLARGFAASLGVEHLVVNTRELDDPNYASNPANRCYFCKSTLYSDLAKIAAERGYSRVMDGANKDDEGDYRPGRKAAKELGVVSPLSLAGMGKTEVREVAKYLGLPSWDKPALACLSSRFPYGQEITPEKLAQVAPGRGVLALARLRTSTGKAPRGDRTLRGRFRGDGAGLRGARGNFRRAQGHGLPLRNAGPRRVHARLPQRRPKTARQAEDPARDRVTSRGGL